MIAGDVGMTGEGMVQRVIHYQPLGWGEGVVKREDGTKKGHLLLTKEIEAGLRCGRKEGEIKPKYFLKHS